MQNTPIHISHDDHAKLRLLLATAPHPNTSGTFRKLREELDRAALLDPAAIPADVVTMESTVEFEDLTTREIDEFTITFPHRADIEQKRISILAPIGIALLGCRVGDMVEWATPGGVRQLKVLHVTAPSPLPAAATFAFAGATA